MDIEKRRMDPGHVEGRSNPAGWPVAAEQYAFLECEKAREKAEEEGKSTPVRPKPATDAFIFARKFKEVVEEETVPEGFPFGVGYDELEKKEPSQS